MNVIDQLEKIVTPAVLGTNSSVAHVSLLGQFYAILVTRLAVPEVYTQLQRNDPSHMEPAVTSSPLFEQLWEQPSQRHLLIQELATTHHIAETETGQLLINAAPLAYQELKNLANGQFLPAFLQVQQPIIRQYLPVWTSAVISPVVAVVVGEPALVSDALIYDNSKVPNVTAAAGQILGADGVPVIVEGRDGQVTVDDTINTTNTDTTGAIHANPSDYRSPESRTIESIGEVRRRNHRNDLLIRLSLLALALGAIVLFWAFVIKPNEVEPVEPIAIAPVVTTPEIEAVAPAQVLNPAQLIVVVDNDGNLYSCSATVGDASLEAALRRALNSSFGEQANICELTVQQEVATTLANINIDTLPNVLTLMRTAPFSRLQLQNDSMSIEGPDEMLLQNLLIEMRTLVPAMNITSAIPATNAQPPANTYDETYNNNGNYNNDDYNNENYNNNGAMPNNGSAPITSNNNMITNQPNPPLASNNSNFETPPPPQPQSSLNNGNNGSSNNINNNQSQNNQPTQNPRQMSQAEVDAIANNTIISEPAQGGHPITQ
ncbi:hypothetical protein [Psychrobacter frigidicola]|uniref:hypothetical protein n=1 Tax=Psychrobacter frigidicola TaxID=45611 RepID=UPI00191A6227|nr:hypothetical protein [Psychrobacter frigidicola]